MLKKNFRGNHYIINAKATFMGSINFFDAKRNFLEATIILLMLNTSFWGNMNFFDAN